MELFYLFGILFIAAALSFGIKWFIGWVYQSY